MKKIIFLIIFIGFSKIYAQQAIVAAGQDATGVGGTISYSISQIGFTTNLGSSGSVSQGVQQPFEISVFLGTEEVLGISLRITVFPNPTTDFITMSVENYEFETLQYQLYDNNGKMLLGEKTNKLETKIEIGNLPTAVYFLKIFNQNKEIKTFKIIKN